jgi:glycerate kinase
MIATDAASLPTGFHPVPFGFALPLQENAAQDPVPGSGGVTVDRHADCPTVLIAASGINQNLDASRVAAAIADAVRAALPSARVMPTPGHFTGGGFLEELVWLSGGTIERLSLLGPHGEDIPGQLGLIGPADELTAVIAVEEALQVSSLPHERGDLTSASSRCIGQLMKAALDRRVRRIIIGCGAGGAYDGGIGMASALGIRFLDPRRVEIAEAGGLLRLATIDMSHRDRRLDGVSIEAVVDPCSDLLGPQGVTRVHGPRTGASQPQVLRLERGLTRYAQVVRQALGIDVTGLPGGGASGGLAAGLVAFVGARLTSQRSFMKHAAALQPCLAAADLVIVVQDGMDAALAAPRLAPTADALAAPEEVPAWVARQARAQGLPVITLTADRLLDAGGAGGGDEVSNVIAPAAWGGNHPMIRTGARLRDVSVTAMRKLLNGWNQAAEPG